MASAKNCDSRLWNHDDHLKKNYKFAFPHHVSTLVSSVKEAYRKHNSFDVVFICHNSVSVKCHKIVLISVSNYLKQIFEPFGHETAYVSLPEVSCRLARLLVNYLYTGTTKIKENEIQEFEALQSLLQITCLKRVAKMKIPKHLNKPSANSNESDGGQLLEEIDLTDETTSNAVAILSNTNPLGFCTTPSKNIIDNTLREIGIANCSIPLSMVQCTSSSNTFHNGMKNIQVKLERLDEEEIRSYVNLPDKKELKNTDNSGNYECVTKRKRKYVISVSANQNAPEETEEKPVPKKKSKHINDCHEMYLQKMFSVEGKPNNIILEGLSKELNIEENRLKKWFDDRQAEDKAKGRKGKGNIVTRRRSGKKKHMTINSFQINVLENEYRRQKCPDHTGIQEISNALRIPVPAVEAWFNNRHIKGRRGISTFIEWEDKPPVSNQEVAVMNWSSSNTKQETPPTPTTSKPKLAIMNSNSKRNTVNTLNNHSVIAVTEKPKLAIKNTSLSKRNTTVNDDSTVAVAEKPKLAIRNASLSKRSTTVNADSTVAVAEKPKLAIRNTSLSERNTTVNNNSTVAVTEKPKLAIRNTSLSKRNTTINNHGGLAVTEKPKLATTNTSLSKRNSTVNNRGDVATTEKPKLTSTSLSKRNSTTNDHSNVAITEKPRVAITNTSLSKRNNTNNLSVVAVTEQPKLGVTNNNLSKTNNMAADHGIIAVIDKPRFPDYYLSSDKLSSKNSITLDTFQVNLLENEFSVQKSPDELSQRHIADMLKIPTGAVQAWFRERQSKGRRGISTLIEWEEQPEAQMPKEKFVRDLSVAERELLEQEYLKDSYPDDEALAHISEKFGLSLPCLRRWYQTKRYGDTYKLFKA